jgi:hypothetical protein
MSETSNFGFGRFVPGFDFLQNLAKGASQTLPQMPNLSNWVAPTLNVEELEKRIGELKAVQFWLEQNGKALAATIQALEVQKMTLATLQGMNFSMGDVANALKLKTAETVASGAHKVEQAAEAMAGSTRASTPRPAAKAAKSGNGKAGDGKAAAAVDPLQWWGALTQQFQEIAANAMKDVAQKTAPAPAQAGAKKAAAPAKKPGARKAPARKTRSKS